MEENQIGFTVRKMNTHIENYFHHVTENSQHRQWQNRISHQSSSCGGGEWKFIMQTRISLRAVNWQCLLNDDDTLNANIESFNEPS